MQVSFLIGNGFDRGLGLRTSFRDFFPVYCKEASGSPEVEAFKDLLRADGGFDRWSDFERALGIHTDQPPLNQEDSLENCLEDFERSFAGYLEREAARIDYAACGRILWEDFARDLSTYRSRLERNFYEEAEKRRPSNCPMTFHLLDFNYTNVLDQLADRLQGHSIINRSCHIDHLGELVHVHGTTQEAMLIGVDNIWQVNNPGLFTSVSQQRLLVKPQLNQQCGCGNDSRAIQCIQNSDEICVLGMSLGETDGTWWRLLLEWLEGRIDRQLLLFFHASRSIVQFPNRLIRRREKWKKLFFDRAGATPADREKLENRVYAAGSYGLFDLQPVLLDSSRTKVGAGG